MVLIRQADPDEDADTILDLQRRILPHDDPLPLDDTPLWWLAWDGDAPVGFASLTPSHQKPNCGYLSRAGVLPSHRGLGIQKRLIRVRVRHAKSLGWDAVVTDCTVTNAASINSLVSCGFRAFVPEKPWAYQWSVHLRRVFWQKSVKPPHDT